MICKATLEKIGKAAYNALSEADKQKYTTASGIIAIITGAVSTGNYTGALLDIGTEAVKVGETLVNSGIIALAANAAGYNGTTVSGALSALGLKLGTVVVSLIDQTKHELAAKLAVLLGIDENPGVLGAILEYIYKVFVQPAFSSVIAAL